MRSCRRVIFLGLAAACALGVVAQASAAMQCVGPYPDSRAWNTGWTPSSGGCWLSGSSCYECWDVVSYETAGCEWGTQGCKAILDPVPFQQTASIRARDETGALIAFCVAFPASGRQLDARDLV